MKKKEQETEIPQWKIDQQYARNVRRGGRLIPNYMMPFDLGIKKFKRENVGKSKLIADFKKAAWDSIKGVKKNEVSPENN